jgi:hypothetical protein
MALEWATPWVSTAGENLPEPALLLRFTAPDIPPGEAKAALGALPGALSGPVRVRWIPVPAEPESGGAGVRDFPVPDDAALRAISGKIAAASIHMDRVEDDAAARLLSEAEAEIRKYRFTDATRPFLAEIFLRAMGGRYDLIRPGVRTGFNPLQLPDTPTNRRFLQQWFMKSHTLPEPFIYLCHSLF